MSILLGVGKRYCQWTGAENMVMLEWWGEKKGLSRKFVFSPYSLNNFIYFADKESRGFL
jgi:hypothetical protein